MGLQDADKISHAGSVRFVGLSGNSNIRCGLVPLPHPAEKIGDLLHDACFCGPVVGAGTVSLTLKTFDYDFVPLSVQACHGRTLQAFPAWNRPALRSACAYRKAEARVGASAYWRTGSGGRGTDDSSGSAGGGAVTGGGNGSGCRGT